MKTQTFNRQQYSRVYGNFRGVDFSGGSIAQSRCAYLENLYRDYDGDDPSFLESVPGYRRICTLSGKINGLYAHRQSDGKDHIIAHAGTGLYRFSVEGRNSVTALTKQLTVKNAKSTSFYSDGDLFILDGTDLIRVTRAGSFAIVGSGVSPYAPIVFQNGEEYEQRNLLTDAFRERFTVTDGNFLLYTTPGLSFSITDIAERECAVTGVGGSPTYLAIPGETTIDGIVYRVTSVAERAFYHNNAIRSCFIAEGITEIGDEAFSGCSYLKDLSLPDSLLTIGTSAFASCALLQNFRLGAGITSIGTNAFQGCASLTATEYGGTQTAFSAIGGISALSGTTPTYGVHSRMKILTVPIYSPAITLSGVTLDGTAQTYAQTTEDGFVTGVYFSVNSSQIAEGATVEITGTLSPSVWHSESKRASFLDDAAAMSVPAADAVTGCTVAAAFDGRIFLSGNPAFPTTVFYSSRDVSGKNNPLYFGELNFFCDGSGSDPVTSMLAVGDRLAVFRAGDSGGGSIFLHTPTETGIGILPKIYPLSYTHTGLPCPGPSISFFDDAVFLSSLGLTALEKEQINLDRSLAVRSHNVNRMLLTEDLSKASMAKWCGYLVISVGGHIYLADSRATFRHESGNAEYEWFYLTGIGAYSSAVTLYRFLPDGSPDYYIYDAPDEPVTTQTYSRINSLGVRDYYTKIGGLRYAVYPTEETVSGTFYPATTLCTVGDLLFFGADNGTIMIFNNDKRGLPPVRIESDEDYDAVSYEEEMKRRIHPDFYDFGGRAVTYALTTAKDDCGLPHLAKSTVSRSLTLRGNSIFGGRITCEVGTDRDGFEEVVTVPASEFSFYDINFSVFMFPTERSYALPIAEKEKNWVDKQICLYSSGFRAPIAIDSIGYRYTVHGQIRIR